MPNKLAFLPYNRASGGVANIRGTIANLSAPAPTIVLQENSPLVRNILQGRPISSKKLIVSWGNSPVLPITQNNVIALNNVPKTKYINKREFFLTFRDNTRTARYLPEAYFSPDRARDAIAVTDSEEPQLVERGILDGHSGAGIRLISSASQISNTARLWTAYKRKKDEWRVHFFKKINGDVELFFQKKLLKRDLPHSSEVDIYKVRNLQSGWVYSPNRTDAPHEVVKAALTFAIYSDLTFGATDIIYNARGGKAYVLEINTAPGVIESTAKWYAKMFSEYYTAFCQGGNMTWTNVNTNRVTISGVTLFNEPIGAYLSGANF